ncbi:MAG: hypothetical protein PHX59_04155, partial [Sulfuricurvum sp.]|nr:hypothetical protein [Sulfuricurvum sp.]
VTPSLKSFGSNHRENEEIFAFGLQLVHSLTGSKAYDTEEPFAEGKKPFAFHQKTLPDAYAPFYTVIERMVHPHPLKRYTVFTEILSDLKEAGYEL